MRPVMTHSIPPICKENTSFVALEEGVNIVTAGSEYHHEDEKLLK
jgi:hypothetical protein